MLTVAPTEKMANLSVSRLIPALIFRFNDRQTTQVNIEVKLIKKSVILSHSHIPLKQNVDTSLGK